MIKFKRSLFISFEGPEASGKSSQIKILSKYFTKNKVSHIVTREPGGTIVSEKLRKIILDKNETISNNEEVLLFLAARLNHLNKVIYPALKNNKIVISDRYADSSFVYQGFVNNYGMSKVMNLHKLLLKNFLPNKTFLFQVSAEEINKRLKRRKGSNKYDKLDLLFHRKVIKGYEKLSKNNNRFVKIDAQNSIKNIHDEIVSTLKKIK